ncbi:MAG TPA: VOC family protein [Marmoricola sp.]|nr:VOC family protein [Marmoricola sp.]
MAITWLTAFVDVPAAPYAKSVAFWSAVTGSTLSPARGTAAEFATFLPPDGDPYLRIQRVDRGRGGVHLDLHDPDHEFAIVTSPGGFVHCEVSGEESTRPVPRLWAGGHTSLVDQITLDIPPAQYAEECAFWAARTGWDLHETRRPELRYLQRPEDQPLRILLQRLDEADGPARAHLDIATSDRALETGRHRDLGAGVLRVRERWTVMTDPAGTPYCITERDPYTGEVSGR